MLERRRRLIKYLFKKEKRLDEFEQKFHENIQKKTAIIRKFTPAQLEDLLRTSTKNVAQEVVSSLIPQKGIGVLADLEKHRRTQANDGSSIISDSSRRSQRSLNTRITPQS